MLRRMTWDGYNKERKLPPLWYSRITTWLIGARYWLAIAAMFAFFAYFIFFHTPYETGGYDRPPF